MDSYRHVKLGTRLLAILYDTLIVFFIIVVSIIVIQLILGQGKEIPADSIIHKILESFWFIISFLYFGYFWTKRGQTPGMKVWKIAVVNRNRDQVSWKQATMRYFFALFGLGLLWSIFDKNKLPLQDRLSHTKLTRTFA